MKSSSDVCSGRVTHADRDRAEEFPPFFIKLAVII